MHMPDYKDFNQAQYSKNFQQYLGSNISNTVGGTNVEARITLLNKYLPFGRTVFEIGSAGGNDAFALKDAGYEIVPSDYVQEFVDLMKEKGLSALSYDAKNDELPMTVDCVYANAVFVHFTPDELSNFLEKAKLKLQNEKIIFMSVIKGEGHERSGRSRGIERDFYYYSTDLLQNIVTKAGFSILHRDDSDPKWIQAIITCK